jgi:PAS domain S-box-containing protein
MAKAIRAHPWNRTPLGPPIGWSQELKTLVALMLASQQPMFIAWGSDRTWLYNDAFIPILGDKHPRALGRPAIDDVWSEARNVLEPLFDCVFSGQPVHMQDFGLMLDRRGTLEEAHFAFSYTPVRDAEARVVGLFGACIETTAQVLGDRRQAAAHRAEDALRVSEQALRRSEEQLRLATEVAEIGLWDVDTVTNTLFWPPRVKAMFGISPDVPVSMADFYAGLHADDREHVSRAFEAALDPDTRALYDVEYRTLGKEDGLVRWVAAKGRAIFDASGRCVRVLGTAIDITARKLAEQHLRHLNETLERRVAEALAERKVLADIVEATDTLIQVIDPNYRFLATNRANADEFERLFGRRPKAGDHLLELFADPLRRRAVHEKWQRALGGEEFTILESFDVTPGDRRRYEMKLTPLRDREGRILGAYQFANDVTERLRDQARLAKAEEQLRQAQKIEAIGQLTGGVAHDFNNLLMVVSGGLDILQRQAEGANRKRIMDGMRNAVDRGAALSRQLLAFSRRQSLKPESVDVAQHIESMRELLDRTLRGDVEVHTFFAHGLWPIRVDPSELELAMLNLCVNSRDAMPRGGTITIRAHNTSQHLPNGVQGDFVRLTVADTGVGMPQEVLARVFEPFFTTKDVGKGSGLGLPQVYGFAKQSGGTVDIESIPGGGTIVSLLLPRAFEAPAATVSRADSHVDNERATGSVLLVEDDDNVASLVSEMLRELGYDVMRAESAERALTALASDRNVDVVFSDIMMPGGMNGVELAKEIRRRRPDIPILLTSGHVEAAKRNAPIPGVEILVKPYEISHLASSLNRAIGNHAARMA